MIMLFSHNVSFVLLAATKSGMKLCHLCGQSWAGRRAENKQGQPQASHLMSVLGCCKENSADVA
jgi:hypothetical protein